MCILSRESKDRIWDGMLRFQNARTMEERCEGMILAGGKFYEDPEECGQVRLLLEGFGEHAWQDNDPVELGDEEV